MKKQNWIVKFINKVDLPWGLSKEQLEELRKEVEQLTSENLKLTALFKTGYRKQSDTVLQDFIKQIEKKFGKSCSEEYPFTFIEMLSTDLEELAEKYGVEGNNEI